MLNGVISQRSPARASSLVGSFFLHYFFKENGPVNLSPDVIYDTTCLLPYVTFPVRTRFQMCSRLSTLDYTVSVLSRVMEDAMNVPYRKRRANGASGARNRYGDRPLVRITHAITRMGLHL